MAFRMQTSVPELTDLSGEPEHVFELYGRRRAHARHLRRQLPAGPAPGRARRALHPALSPGLGPARRTCPRDIRKRPVQDVDQPPPRWSRTSSSAACSTTRSSSGAANSAAPPTRRAADQGQLRPRPPSALLHDLDGRRRRQGRPHLRRDRRLRLQHRRRIPSTSTTSRRRCSTCWASTTNA